jgi:SET domain-containing protein
MSTTYHLSSAEELTMDIVEAIKATFKSKPITIIIEEDEVDFELFDAMKLKLDERLLEEKPSYITSEESIRKLEEKYGL